MPTPTAHNLPLLAQTLSRSGAPLLAHAISTLVFLGFISLADHIPFKGTPLQIILTTLPLFFLVLTFVFNIVSLYDYTNALALPRSMQSMIRVAAYWPILGVLTAVALRIPATRILRSAGATVTRKGVSPEDVAALSLNWCEHCGYSRAGISRTAPCPECGELLAATNP